MGPIYTKTGDAGETGLFGGGRVSKSDARVDAYGEVDELNAALGAARAARLDPQLDQRVASLQGQLFTVGAVLATPLGSKAAAHIPQVDPLWATQMEAEMDAFDRELPPLTQFILPGGTLSASLLHLARTVCRRAERRIVPLIHTGQVPAEVGVYLNRLSDFLFTLARVENVRAGGQDVLWAPPPLRRT